MCSVAGIMLSSCPARLQVRSPCMPNLARSTSALPCSSQPDSQQHPLRFGVLMCQHSYVNAMSTQTSVSNTALSAVKKWVTDAQTSHLQAWTFSTETLSGASTGAL